MSLFVLGIAGGLTALSKIPACNILVSFLCSDKIRDIKSKLCNSNCFAYNTQSHVCNTHNTTVKVHLTTRHSDTAASKVIYLLQ